MTAGQATLALGQEEWEPWALTLHLPWSWAMVHAPEDVRKRVENRDWPPPPRIASGQWFLLHAGQALDDAEAWGFIGGVIGRPPPTLEELRAAGQVGALLAFARVVGVVEGTPSPGERVTWRGLPAGQERWFFGPYGWVLDVRPLEKPVPCRGWHKLWRVEAQIRKSCIEKRVAEAMADLHRQRERLAA